MRTNEPLTSPASTYFIYTPSKTAQNIFFYPMQCGTFIYKPGYKLQRNSFDSFLLMYIHNGEMLLEYENTTQLVREKSFVLIDCYKPHAYSTVNGYECSWMHFDGPSAGNFYNQILSRLGNVFEISNAYAVIEKLNAILNVFSENKTVREPLLSKYINDILTEFMLASKNRSSSNADIAERAITYINEHFSEDIAVPQLSAMFGLSSYHFIRVFKQETGYTPHEYCTNRRMASARYLLRYTQTSIKEICYTTGFSSESVFCNAFKKHHGMTAQSFRLQGSDENFGT